MRYFLRQIFSTQRYLSLLERDRASLVYVIATIGLVGLSFYFALVNDWAAVAGGDWDTAPLIRALNTPSNIAIFLSLYILYPLIVVLTRIGQLRLASWLLPFIFFIPAVGNSLLDPRNFSNATDTLVLVVFTLLMGFFNEQRGLAFSAVVVALLFLLDNGEQTPTFIANYSLLFTGLFALVALYLRFARLSRMEGEGMAGIERVRLAEITTSISRKASQRVSLDELLNYGLALIRETYPQFYHAQVFLIDEKRVQARLVVSTGEAGRILLARNHALSVGSLSVIGQVTFKGKALIAQAGSPESIHRPNDVLPNTRTEAAFPLRIEEEVIGALDLQSKQFMYLRDEEIQTFQSLADSLALAIDNVRQFENARARALESQRLAEQARSALNEVQRLNKRLIGRAWSDYLQDRGSNFGLEVNLEDEQTRDLPDNSPMISRALSEQTLVRQANQVAVPLQVRGQVIGALEFEVEEDAQFSTMHLDLLAEISERLGLAAENARLVEESQRAAQREALINEVSTRLQTTNTVETTLTEAARSLRETLNVNRIVIRLGTPSSAKKSDKPA